MNTYQSIFQRRCYFHQTRPNLQPEQFHQYGDHDDDANDEGKQELIFFIKIRTCCTADMPQQMFLQSGEPCSTIPRRRLHPDRDNILKSQITKSLLFTCTLNRCKGKNSRSSQQPVHRLIGIQARRLQQPHCLLCTRLGKD